jgi:peptidoglycan/xylan/chitin deacetylase (PgdA/CDA1 family)
MDHDHYDWSPLNQKRPALRWPDQARVALCVIVNLEHMEWRPPEGHFQSPNLAGGYGPAPFPDVTRWSHREYGHRVGIFRLMDMLHTYGIKVTVAMDALTAEHYPYLVRYCLSRGCEMIAHGVSVSRVITSNMTEQDERAYLQTSVDALTRATGVAPLGWLGPEYGESTRTPQLLAQVGIRYVCDWVNDEQPYPLKTPQGDLLALPITLPLDDVNALWDRRVPIRRYAEMLKDSFDTLYQDGAENGRLLTLNFHPWLMGQPFRIRYLHDAIGYIMRQPGVWTATGAEIIEWYRQHPPGVGNEFASVPG